MAFSSLSCPSRNLCDAVEANDMESNLYRNWLGSDRVYPIVYWGGAGSGQLSVWAFPS